MRVLTLFSFLLNLQLFAGIEDFFRPLLDKSGSHQMRNIDFIYTINLDERPEKFQSCIEQLNPLGIYPCRFPAVNGWKIPIDDLTFLGVPYETWMTENLWGTYYLPENGGEPSHEIMHSPGRVYFCHCMSRGAIGISLSHLSVLQDAYDSGYETIWVMEDDIEVHQDPHQISDLIDKLDSLVGKNNWDALFTDPDTKNQHGEYVPCLAYAQSPNFQPANPNRFWKRERISEDFTHIGARYGAYSVIIRRSGMKKILDFYKQYRIFLPYDMTNTLPNNIQFYSLNYDVVSTQPRALSDNGGPRYEEKLPCDKGSF